MKLKRYFKSFFILSFLLVSIGGLKASSNELLEPFKQLTPLAEILEEFSERYEIIFSYESRLLEEVKVDFEFRRGESAEGAMNRLLAQTKLRYQTIGTKYYVLHQHTKKGNRNAKKLKRKIRQIQKLEQKGKLSLNKIESNSQSQIRSIVTSVSELKKVVTVTGTVISETGEPLVGVNILIKGSATGTITDLDGKYFIDLPNGDEILVFSYIGYADTEISVQGQSVVNVTLEGSATGLDEIVVTGIRGAEARAIQAKKIATSVVETISPQDLGNFSDENIGDALRRVPGVQVQEDQSGGQDGGSRVSIRGIGPAFVRTTINGRQPLSAGIQGVGGFRQFNVNILPPEVMGGATVYKTSEAGLIEPGLGGLVDFQTIKPLDMNYKYGDNIFGSINLRGELDGHDDDFLTPTARISGIVGGKTKNNKFGAYISGIYSSNERRRDQGFTRVLGATRNVREDSNGNGVWDGAAGGDTEHQNVIVPNSTTYNPLQEQQERLGISSAVQWRPVESLTVTADVLFSRFDLTSTRPLIRPLAGNTLFNAAGTRVFAPGSLNIAEDGFLESFNTVGAFNADTGEPLEGGILQYQNVVFDLLTDTWVGGLNATWEKDGWKIAADYSKSDVSFRYDLTVYGRSAQSLANPNIAVNGPWVYDGTDFPSWTLDQESQAEWNQVLASNGIVAPNGFQQLRYMNGTNDAFRLDVSKELSDKISIDFGTRYSVSDYYIATIIRAGGAIQGQVRDANGDLLIADNSLFDGTIQDFLPGSGFSVVNSWPSLNQEAYFNEFPQIFGFDPSRHPILQRGVNILDVNDLVDETIEDGTDEGFVVNGTPFGLKEATTAFYSQINLDTKLGNLPLSGNLGLRAVRTEYTGSSFSNITLSDPTGELPEGTQVFGRVPNTVNDARWDFLPSLNLKLKFTPDFHYRFGLVRTMTRPEITQFIPSGNLTGINNAASTFDGASGNVTLPNTALEPFSTWQLDNTFELYNNHGAAFVSVFYKNISNYIGNDARDGVSFEEVLEDGGFGTEALSEAGVIGQFQNQTYNVSQPQNIGDAELFGIEVGFNQRLSFIADGLRNFGLQANYNYVTASFNNTENDIDDAFPGTSQHNFNSVLYFENDKFSIRAAYSVRSNFLRTLSGQGLTNLPEWTVGRGQLDLRASYSIKKNIQFSLAIQNVTGADQSTIFSNNPNRAFQLISQSPIYTFGLRYGF